MSEEKVEQPQQVSPTVDDNNALLEELKSLKSEIENLKKEKTSQEQEEYQKLLELDKKKKSEEARKTSDIEKVTQSIEEFQSLKDTASTLDMTEIWNKIKSENYTPEERVTLMKKSILEQYAEKISQGIHDNGLRKLWNEYQEAKGIVKNQKLDKIFPIASNILKSEEEKLKNVEALVSSRREKPKDNLDIYLNNFEKLNQVEVVNAY